MYDFESVDWKKNWDGGWSLLSSYYFGYQVTKQLNDVLGVSLEKTLTVTERGLTACYFSESLKREFADVLVGWVKRKPEILNEWSERLTISTDRIFRTLDRMKIADFSEVIFQEYVAALYEYGLYHRIVKVVVDYLDVDILNEYLPILSEARVYAEPVYERTEQCMRHFAEILSKRHGISSELILAMTVGQFERLLKENVLSDVTALELQNEFAVLFIQNGEPRYFFGEEAVSIERSMFHRETEIGEIRGMIAFAGKATGRVRIIQDATKEHVFDEGDILVTGMTRPEYLPYIRKASGFVTDAGGLLSHAAISARELKKPCVIGTENATRVLRDGDLVEVDADHGVVRKIGERLFDEQIPKNNSLEYTGYSSKEMVGPENFNGKNTGLGNIVFSISRMPSTAIR